MNKTDSGYTFNLRVPGSPVQVFTDKNFLAYRIVSGGGQVDEHVSYVQKSVGLVFGADDTVDIGDKGEKVTVKYELDYAIINGLNVPSSVHLIVDRNIDVRFALTGCSVQKNLVIHVEPPPAKNP